MQLFHDPADIVLDGALGKKYRLRDLPVAHALRDSARRLNWRGFVRVISRVAATPDHRLILGNDDSNDRRIGSRDIFNPHDPPRWHPSGTMMRLAQRRLEVTFAISRYRHDCIPA